MRTGIAEPVSLALIALVATFVTSYFEYKNNNSMAKAIYPDHNITKPCVERKYSQIIITDE